MRESVSLWLRLAAKVAIGAGGPEYSLNLEPAPSNSVKWQLCGSDFRVVQEGVVDAEVWQAELASVIFDERARP